MTFVMDFLENLYTYIIEVAPALAIGFLISGIIREAIPSEWISKYPSGKGLKPLFYATFAGISTSCDRWYVWILRDT